MNFLAGVNRLLREVQIIAGLDDEISSFSDTQHRTTLELAKLAIQQELASLAAHELLPTELRTGDITTVAGTRTYKLPADFQRFLDKYPFIYSTDSPSSYIYEYPGGRGHMKLVNRNWQSAESETAHYWYYEPTTSSATQKEIGLLSIPSTSGKVYEFEYEGSVYVTDATDNLPFITQMESDTFIAIAARRWLFNDNKLRVANLDEDGTYSEQKSTLIKLITPRYSTRRYGRRHHGSSRGIGHGGY